jgi:Fic family protein
MYNWQFKAWPNFIYDLQHIQPFILAFAEETGIVTGVIKGLPDHLQLETLVQLMLAEAVKTSEIEGEYFSREDVLSSIRNNLGLNSVPAKIKNKQAIGVAQLMGEVRRLFEHQLTEEIVKEWHQILMVGRDDIHAGEWRTGEAAMQIISGAHGREIVHFEAPPSAAVQQEMDRFIAWYNSFTAQGNIAAAVLKSAIAHLYFESIHPFVDGNGRIGRAIAEHALSQSLDRPVMLSLSKIIEKNKKAYYNALKEAQTTLKITPWITYFAGVIIDAQRDARLMVQFTLHKLQFFDRYKDQFNARQLKAVNKMLESGMERFEGGMTANKYISINKTSKATATRDLQELLVNGVLLQEGGGRSVSYQLNLGYYQGTLAKVTIAK